jgi:hypothetical protein
MTRKALTALKSSIAHWERLASGKRRGGESIGSSHCALCRKFLLANPLLLDCEGCPVKEKTGYHGCQKTPYQDVELVFFRQRQDISDSGVDWDKAKGLALDTPEFKRAAKKELAFLKSLLPKGPAK